MKYKFIERVARGFAKRYNCDHLVDDLISDAYEVAVTIANNQGDRSNTYIRTAIMRRLSESRIRYLTPVSIPRRRKLKPGNAQTNFGIMQIFTPNEYRDVETLEDESRPSEDTALLIEKVLASLSEDEYTLIDRRYGLTRPAETLQQIADGEGVTREAIRQREQKVIDKMRKKCK